MNASSSVFGKIFNKKNSEKKDSTIFYNFLLMVSVFIGWGIFYLTDITFDVSVLWYHYLTDESEVTVLAPNGAWQEVRKFGGLRNNYVIFNNGTTWTEDFANFRAVKAEHSDEYAIGVIICAEGKNYYITGDTLYNEQVFASLPKILFEAVLLPVNGIGNNMNFEDAKKIAERINAKSAIPIHIGMFDDKRVEEWSYKNKILHKIYTPYQL